MVVTRGGGSGSCSGLEPIDERLCELIVAAINLGIFDGTAVMFGTINEGIMDLMDERL